METIHTDKEKKSMGAAKPKAKPEKDIASVAPAIKKNEREISFDIDGHPYVKVKVMRGRGRNRKEREIKVHPNLVDSDKKKFDSATVKGKFVFHAQRGGKIKFLWGLPYMNEKPKLWEFQDGEVVEIPRALMRHLQEKGKYPIHTHMKDQYGNPSKKIGQWVDRFDFFEIGSVIERDPSRKIVTVENI